MASVTGLEGIVAAETDISLVDGERGRLVYRGYEAKELAVSKTFEQVAFLLWNGRLPDAAEEADLKKRLAAGRTLPGAVKRLLDLLPDSAGPMGALQTAIAAIGAMEGGAWPPSPAEAERLTAVVPTIIAYRARKAAGLAEVEPDPGLGHAANYLRMLTGQAPAEAHAAALDAYLVLGMEHGLNASTFAGRVILSTQAGMGAAVSGAIGAMGGPLHGGAPYEVVAMLEAIGTKERAEPWMRGVLESGGRLMGFGHRIYKTTDPRAEALREATLRLTGREASFELALFVEKTAVRLLAEYKPGRRLHTNVEFFAAAILRALKLPPELFTPTFTAARMAGWTAHLLEQARVNRIFRPRSVYTGNMPEPIEPDPV